LSFGVVLLEAVLPLCAEVSGVVLLDALLLGAVLLALWLLSCEAALGETGCAAVALP